MAKLAPVADWMDADAYAPLLDADRSIFAWEWLRRDPGYRVDAEEAASGRSDAANMLSWGLHRFDDPSRSAPAARPFWRADFYNHVLKAVARPATGPADAFDVSRIAQLATLVKDEVASREHWLFSDGLSAIRVDLVAGTATDGPVMLHYLMAGRAAAVGPILSLRRLLALIENGAFSRTLHPREPRARRWILALRVHDALAAGAGQREIAAELLSDAAAELRWRVHAASVRSQVQRLVRAARRSARGRHRAFLL